VDTTSGPAVPDDAVPDDVDRIVRDLQRLRVVAGGVSYAEIVRRVTTLRQAAGMPGLIARPARTTVYDAFRPGRTRLDADLVGDIAAALGGDREQFRARCLHVRLAAEVTAGPPIPTPDPDPVPLSTPAADPTQDPPAADRGRAHTSYTVVVLLGCLALNLFGYVAVEVFDLAIFLDMTGTGIAAIALGPWHGALVAIATHAVGLGVHGTMTVPFVIVNIAGALIWGYGVRRFGQGSSLPRFFLLTLLVAAVCTALATPILLGLYDGGTGHSASLVQGLVELGEPFGLAVLHANLMMSAADKLISGFIILTVVSGLSRRWPIPGGDLFLTLGSLDRSGPRAATATPRTEESVQAGGLQPGSRPSSATSWSTRLSESVGTGAAKMPGTSPPSTRGFS